MFGINEKLLLINQITLVYPHNKSIINSLTIKTMNKAAYVVDLRLTLFDKSYTTHAQML